MQRCLELPLAARIFFTSFLLSTFGNLWSFVTRRGFTPHAILLEIPCEREILSQIHEHANLFMFVIQIKT